MPPLPHPVLKPHLIDSHLSAVDSYAAGPGLRATAPMSPSGVKKAKKTRAAYISRLRRAAYMKLLESACQQAEGEVKHISARLEAEEEENFVLLQGIRALQEYLKEGFVQRRHSGSADVVTAVFEVPEVATSKDVEVVAADCSDAEVKTADFAAAEVVGADFWVAEVAVVEEAEKDAREIHGRNVSASNAEAVVADIGLVEVAAAEGAEVAGADFGAEQVAASDFEVAGIVPAGLTVAEVAAAEEAKKTVAERRERAASQIHVFGSRFTPELWVDVDLDFSSSLRGTVSA